MGVGVVGGTSQLEGIYNAVTNSPKPAIVDPMLQPAFYVTTNNMYPSTILIYNHYMQLIGTTYQGNESYSMNQWTSSYGTEFNENYGYNSSYSTSGTGYFHTACLGRSNYLGHRYFEVTSSPTSNSDIKVHHRGNGGNGINYAGWYYLGNIVSDSTTNAHKVIIGVTGTSLYLTGNSSKEFGQAAHSSFTKGYNGSISGVFSGLGAVSSAVASGISYNATTKTLLILGRDGYSHYPIIYTNVDHPAGYLGNVEGWIAHILTKPKYVNTSSAAYKPTNGGSEDQVRAQVTLTDTGRIYYFTQITNYGATSSYWTFNGTTISANTHLSSQSWTNISGIANDTTWGGGSQYNMTNDTNTIFLYSQAYYYMGGMYGIYIDVKTGRALHNYTWQTSDTCSMAPFGKNKFITGQTSNADSGSGFYAKVFSFDQEYQYRTGGQGSTNSVVSVGDSITSGVGTQWMDSPYHSTNYPSVCQVNGYDKALVGGQK